MPNPLNILQRLMMPEGLPETPFPPRGRRPGPIVAGDDVGGIPSGPPVRIDDPNGKLTGNYSRPLLTKIRDEAKLAGVDPLTALAMAGQETTFGKYGGGQSNPLHLSSMHGNHPYGDIAGALEFFKKRSSRFPDDEELAIQSYNGLGKIQGGSEIPAGEQMYGGQTQLHGAKDRPYGKAIIKLREMLAQQPSIKGLIK